MIISLVFRTSCCCARLQRGVPHRRVKHLPILWVRSGCGQAAQVLINKFHIMLISLSTVSEPLDKTQGNRKSSFEIFVFDINSLEGDISMTILYVAKVKWWKVKKQNLELFDHLDFSLNQYIFVSFQLEYVV